MQTSIFFLQIVNLKSCPKERMFDNIAEKQFQQREF